MCPEWRKQDPAGRRLSAVLQRAPEGCGWCISGPVLPLECRLFSSRQLMPYPVVKQQHRQEGIARIRIYTFGLEGAGTNTGIETDIQNRTHGVYVSLSLSLSFICFVCVFVCACPSVSLPVSICLSVFLTLCLSLSLSLSLGACLTVCACVRDFLLVLLQFPAPV